LICDKCHAGQMVEYQREVGTGSRKAVISGTKCTICGFTLLVNDLDIWAAVGL